MSSKSASRLFSKLKHPYTLSIPLLATTAASAYSVYKYSDVVSVVENHYLAKVPLAKPHLISDDSTTSNNPFLIHGKTIDFSDEKILKKLIQEDRERLTSYYRKHNSQSISVSSEENFQDNKLNLFVHLRDKNPVKNVNNLWIENTHLNQLSIDRYGYEYDDKGVKKESSKEPKLHKLINWHDIELDKMSLEEKPGTFPSISFRFFNKDIPKSETEILHNEDENKFKLEEADKKEKGVSLDWFVWLDKSLLAIKLNYALQTYVFNQAGAHQENIIKTIVGEDALAKNQDKSNDQQRAKWNAIQSNYKNLPEGYEQFAKDYIKTFIDKTGTENNYKWSEVINYVTSTNSFIKVDDLNKIYNRFQEEKLGIELFQQHLIFKISAGKTGSWKVALNLEKEKKEEEKDKDKKPEEDNPLTKTFEPREIKALTANVKEEEEERKKHVIKLLPDIESKNPILLKDIFNRLTKYSVKNFVFSDQEQNYISTVYSEGGNKETLSILKFQHQNEYGIYLHEKWIPAVLTAVFLLGISTYLITAFKGPGGLIAATSAASAVNVAGVFFALGSQLSLIGVFASFIGLFYTLFLSFYTLGFLKKIFSLEFLDATNVWVVFKRGIIMATDISLPLFIFSTFIVFMAPTPLQEFGIVLALFTMISYLFVSIVGCLMAVQRTAKNFINLGAFFFDKETPEDLYLKACNKVCSSKKGWIATSSLLLLIGIIATGLFFSLGFNSFSFMKDNYLVIGNKDFTFSSNTPHIPLSSKSSSVYLVQDLSDNLLSSTRNNTTIISTNAFRDNFTVYDLTMSMLFSNALIASYVFIRFKFKNLLILLLNTFLSFVLFAFLLLSTRINITSSIFLSICSFFAISLVYNLAKFSLDSNKNLPWFTALFKDINNLLHTQLRWSIIWLILSLSVTFFTSFWTLSALTLLSIVCVHLFSTFIYQFLFEILEHVRHNYLWKQVTVPALIPSETQTKQYVIEEEESLDLYDEEIIEGINRNY